MRCHRNWTIVLAGKMMIIALKTRILVIEIAICEARAGEGGRGGRGGVGRLLA